MKKVLWTSLVWTILFLVFIAYMRFFNLDLGTKFCCKILNAYDCNCPEIDQMIGEETKEIDEEIDEEEMEEIDEEIVMDKIDEEKDNADREKLFEQLDRIEVLVEKNSKTEKNEKKSEEELFDDFKEWYNQEKDDKDEK